MAKSFVSLAAAAAFYYAAGALAAPPGHGGESTKSWNGYGNGNGETSYSIPTAATAAPTASGVAINNGKQYINYTTVPGYFLQDDASTDASTFNYMTTNFGLINQTLSLIHI